ncbi:MAG: nucleoside kinase [Lachnospiraceae bacterium]|nr:nucleoside kinase [Lachnospiraceae bacterium]
MQMSNQVTVTIDGKEIRVEKGTTFEAIVADYQEQYDGLIAAVIVDNKICELMKTVKKDCKLSFVTKRDSIGHKTYSRTAIMVMTKAIHDVVGSHKIDKIKVEFAIADGLYCSGHGDFVIDQDLVDRVKVRMQELIDAKTPIFKRNYHIEEAIRLFEKHGMKDKVKLFRYRRSSTINVYELEGFYDYFYGYMLPSADYVQYFDLIPYEGGFMLLLPNKKEPTTINPFVPREKLFNTLQRTTEWGIRTKIDTVGDLNNEICAGRATEMVLVQEALQERRISEIAKDIMKRGGIKFVMIAGPSSSGKTSFSHRLSIQLQTLGLVPHPIGIDDYFVNRDKTPRDEKGDYNFECLEAIDVEQFNRDMSDLLAGKEVELPSFNFKTGIREYKGNVKRLGEEDVLVIEGIHGLNDKMSYALPVESKYKIYISALTTLNVDEHNRIPTTDARLLRRMVRDARTRGISAKRTIEMWPSVRRGEEENIFPYQESADAMFNSALIYEIAALKQYAEPLLFGIHKGEPEYFEAKRLLKFLEYFLGISSDIIPRNSIMREFVGGSYFHV